MAGEWDIESITPVTPAQTIQRDVPTMPRSGTRNAFAPRSMRVVATVPPRPSTAERITFRAPTAEELAKDPNIAQVSSRGEYKYRPAGVSTGGGTVKLSQQDSKFLTDIRTKVAESKNLSTLLDEFVSLNKDVDTGGIVGYGATLPGVKSLVNAFDDKRSRMAAIVDQVTPAMRNGLPGAASDRDVAMFRNATVGLDKPHRTNIAIRDAMKAMQRRQGDYLAFMEAYARKNGNILGADEVWNDYRDAHPVFKGEDKDGFPIINDTVPWRSVIKELKPRDLGSEPSNGGWGKVEVEH